jgi:hypothetical protein
MKDKKTISTISTIYFAIVSFFIFIFLFFSFLFFTFKSGLYLDKLSFSNIEAKELSIRWDEGFKIAADEFYIVQTREGKKKQKSSNNIQNYMKLLKPLLPLLNSLSIENFLAKKHRLLLETVDLNYKKISYKTSIRTLEALFQNGDDFALLKIQKYFDTQYKTQLHGEIIFNKKDGDFYARIETLINNDANLTLYVHANRLKADYTIKSKKPIKQVNALLSLLPMPKAINFWANHAIDAKSATIKSCYGFVEYKNLNQAYKNLFAEIDLKSLNYTYNPKLDAIHTKHTQLQFKNGVLYIYPKEAYSYGMFLDKSWLKIDFTQPQEKLSLYLDFNGTLNKDILHILTTYGINVPFLQKSGITKSKLQLVVDLRDLKVDAHGEFYTKEALFNYLGLKIAIKNSFIKLDNYNITIPKMKASYRDIASADVTVHYNAKNATGNIDFKLHKVKLQNDLYLKNDKKPLAVTYHISPKGDTIKISKSHWQVKDFELSLAKNSINFNLKKLLFHIPPVTFQLQNTANGYFSGTYNLKTNKLQGTIDLLNFKYQGLKSSQTDTLLEVEYNKELKIKSQDDIYFSLNGSNYKITSFEALFNSDTITLKHTNLQIGKIIKTKVYATYKYKTKMMHLSLNNFEVTSPNKDKILYKKNKIFLKLYFDKDKLFIDANELRAHFVSTNKLWSLELNDIYTIAKNSPFLQFYKIKKGKLLFIKEDGRNNIKFNGIIEYPYGLLCNKNNDDVHTYNIEGYISKIQSIYINFNKKVHIKVTKPLKISINNSGVDIFETIDFIKMLQQNSNTSSKPINILVNANNSYLKLDKERVILADSIQVQFYNDILTAQLRYKNGTAGIKLSGDSFHLYGKNFNDQFMNKLFALSKFKGGRLNFTIDGKLDEYKGIFLIKDTTMLEYVVLNNVLAFINTIPSLATFSLPAYNRNGLYVENAYMRFHAKNSHFDISDLYIGSKEMQIAGKGIMDLNQDVIDLTMNLKTDIGSNISKIPVVGYILLDGKNVSTTLKVSGKLHNPKVETMIAKDIVVAPLNIIMRTLKLPLKLFNTTENNTSK